jgi:glutamate/tyrosine decarboxylase-like PLP-dependent enzyme
LTDAARAALRRELTEPFSPPDPAELHAAGAAVLDWWVDDFSRRAERPVGRGPVPAELDALLHEPPPERGRPFADVFAEFRDKVVPNVRRTDHPRFLAFVPSAPSFPAVLGEWLCGGCNFFNGIWEEGAAAAQIEVVVLEWFKEWLGLPAAARGILTGGGSEANLTALAVARDRLPWPDRPRAVLYVSSQRHASVDRAMMVLGYHPSQVRTVPVDDRLRFPPEALREAVRRDRAAGLVPWAAVASAGATNTGTVDPLAALADVCRDERLWLHADAAYGWSAVLTPEGRAELDGIARADSVTLDPHKWLAQPYDAGCVLVRDGQLLTDTFTQRPDYLSDVKQNETAVHFADRGLALTRRFRALKIWLAVKVLGVGWFRELVRRDVRLAEYAQAVLEATPGFEIVHPRQLSIVCYRHVPPALDGDALDAWNLQLLERVRATGRAFLSSTRLGGRIALRMCFINWRTTADDVDEVVRLLVEAAHCA